jgi:hypothetical protein
MQKVRIVTVGVSGGRSLTRPLRDARRFPSTRVNSLPGATRTPLGFGIRPSFKGPFLSRRAKPKPNKKRLRTAGGGSGGGRDSPLLDGHLAAHSRLSLPPRVLRRASFAQSSAEQRRAASPQTAPRRASSGIVGLCLASSNTHGLTEPFAAPSLRSGLNTHPSSPSRLVLDAAVQYRRPL